MTTDYAACYRQTRNGLTDLTRGLDDATLAHPVPATPAWSVRDAVAHVVGVTVDLLDGNLAGVGSDEWTAAQVERRRGRPFEDVLTEWSERGPILEEQIAGWPPEFATQLIGDLAVHDLDVRRARHHRRTRLARRARRLRPLRPLARRSPRRGRARYRHPRRARSTPRRRNRRTHDPGSCPPLRAPARALRPPQRHPDPHLRLGRRPRPGPRRDRRVPDTRIATRRVGGRAPPSIRGEPRVPAVRSERSRRAPLVPATSRSRSRSSVTGHSIWAVPGRPSIAVSPVSDPPAPVTIDVDREAGLTVTWADGVTRSFGLEELRQGCPCADCRTRRDSARPVWPLPSSPQPLRITDAELVGAWGLGITWNDGHRTGIFSWTLLRGDGPA